MAFNNLPCQPFHFKSCANWPKGTFSAIGDKSEDTHQSLEAAVAICKLLRKQGAGGDGVSFPLATWVEEYQGNEKGWVKVQDV